MGVSDQTKKGMWQIAESAARHASEYAAEGAVFVVLSPALVNFNASMSIGDAAAQSTQAFLVSKATGLAIQGLGAVFKRDYKSTCILGSVGGLLLGAAISSQPLLVAIGVAAAEFAPLVAEALGELY